MALTQVQGGMILPSTTLTTPIVATTMGVGGATPASSGSGITFPATQSASTDANTLDDYEEGTWTPTITFGGSSTGMTFIDQTGNYTKVGNMVFAHGSIVFSNKGSATGTAVVSLPFASKSGPPYAGPRSGGFIGSAYNFTSVSNGVTFFIDHSDSVTAMFQGNNSTALTNSNFANNTSMYGFCIVYQTN